MMSPKHEDIILMAYLKGEGRCQGALFPVLIDDLIPADHMCRVIDAFVGQLAMDELGFQRASPADTGRPGYDPRSMLKLYLYGYLNQIRSSRRLEAECRRNVEVMWLLERIYPDYKSIAEFRRMHREAVTEAGAELIRFGKRCGLIRGEWIAVDVSKFRAVSSIDTARERFQLQRYLDTMEKVDLEQQPESDTTGVQAALERLKRHPEPEVSFMVMGRNTQPAYNMQSAVDAENALVIAHEVVLDAADSRCLEPMADAAKAVIGSQNFNVVADAGYSNAEQAANCEAKGIFTCVPAIRTRNSHGDGTLYPAGKLDMKPRPTHTFALVISRSGEEQSTQKTNRSCTLPIPKTAVAARLSSIALLLRNAGCRATYTKMPGSAWIKEPHRPLCDSVDRSSNIPSQRSSSGYSAILAYSCVDWQELGQRSALR